MKDVESLAIEKALQVSPDEQRYWKWMKTYIIGKRINIFLDHDDDKSVYQDKESDKSGWYEGFVRSYNTSTGLFQVQFEGDKGIINILLNNKNVRCKAIDGTFRIKGKDSLGKEAYLAASADCERSSYQQYFIHTFKQHYDGTIESTHCPGEVLEVTNGICDIRNDTIRLRNKDDISNQRWCIDINSKDIFNHECTSMTDRTVGGYWMVPIEDWEVEIQKLGRVYSSFSKKLHKNIDHREIDKLSESVILQRQLIDVSPSKSIEAGKEWYLKTLPNYYVDLEGLFFFSGTEYRLWKGSKDLQKKFPDPLGKDFITFKRWFIRHGIKKKLDNNEAIRLLKIWKIHVDNHSKFHPNAAKAADVGVNIIGWHGGKFSIAIQANKLVAAAKSVGIRVNPVFLKVPKVRKLYTHPEQLGYNLTRSVSQAIMIYTLNPPEIGVVKSSIPAILEDYKYNIGYWAWELDIVPTLFMNTIGRFDEIWCPSHFIKTSIETSPGYDETPIRVVPLPLLKEDVNQHKYFSGLEGPVIEKNVKPVTEEDFTKGSRHRDDPFTFSIIFDFESAKERKNPFAPIRAFLDAFPLEDKYAFNYRLVVKAHSGTKQELKELRAAVKEDPRIIFIHRVLSDAENVAFHSSHDCYVSLHRSEGYGLNILESMGSGIPTITTNYSGNVDFYNAIPDSLIGKCHFPVPYKLVELKQTYGLYTAGNHWAEPDHQYVVHAMRTVVQNNCKKLHGAEMAKAVINQFGVEVVGNQMKKLIEDAFPRILEKQSKFIAGFQEQMKVILEQID